MAARNKPRSFLSHTATYAVGNIVRRMVGFAMLPIYTRFLTPADYGVVGLLTFALALFEPILGARLGAAIPKFYYDAEDDRARRSVIWGGLAFTGGVSAVSLVFLVMFRESGSELLFGTQRYAFAMGLFFVALLSQPVEQTGMMYMRMKERSGLFLTLSLMKLLLQLGLNLALVVYWRLGVLGVVVSTVTSSMVLGIAVTSYVAFRERPAFDWGITRKMIQFCWPLWMSGLAGLYIGSSGGVYLRVFDTLSDVGRLELALRFAAVVVMLIWNPFYQHWEPMSFKYYREGDGRWRFQAAFIAMAAVLFSGGIGIALLGGPVIQIMASKPFHSAGSVVPILTLGFVLNSLRSFFSFGFMATGNTRIHTVCQYVTALVITGAYVILVPRFGLMGAAFAQCAAFAVGFVFVWSLSRRYFDPGFNITVIGIYTGIGLLAYVLAAHVVSVTTVGTEVVVRSVVVICATALIAIIALREAKLADGIIGENLPWPLNRIQRLDLGRHRRG